MTLTWESINEKRKSSLGDLSVFTDEVIVKHIFRYFSIEDLTKTIPHVSHIFYIFSNEEILWKSVCLQRYGGDFIFQGTWKQTALTSPKQQLENRDKLPLPPPTRLVVSDFSSQYLYHKWYLANLPLHQFQADYGQIQRIDVQANPLSLEQFIEEYDSIGKILVFKNLTNHWKAMENWKQENLVRLYGDAEFKISHQGGEKVRMNLPNYFLYTKLQHDEAPLYVFDSSFGEKAPQMLDDYEVPVYFREDFFELLDTLRPNYRWIVIGPQRSGSPWHIDPDGTSAWNSLISGRKRWAFYPPHMVPPGLDIDRGKHGNSTSYESPFPVEWFNMVYPQLPPHLRPLEVTQEAGELIYVPRGWWHMVVNLEDTVAVTQNFVNRQNLRTTLIELVGDDRHKDFERFSARLLEKYPEFKEMVEGVREEFKDHLENKELNHQGKLTESEEELDCWSAVQKLCQFHQFDVPLSKNDIMLAAASTNMVFIYNDLVIKFFTKVDDHDGDRKSFEKEVELYRALSTAFSDSNNALVPGITNPASMFPELKAKGKLVLNDQRELEVLGDSGVHGDVAMTEVTSVPQQRTWHYIVTNRLLGDSIIEVYPKISYENLLQVADFVAQSTKVIHSVPLKSLSDSIGSPQKWFDFLNDRWKICLENHRKWGSLTYTMTSQIEEYMKDSLWLLSDSSIPLQLMHCDLTDENIIGHYQSQRKDFVETYQQQLLASLDDSKEQEQKIQVDPVEQAAKRAKTTMNVLSVWNPSGLIDFGDATAGDKMYELVALHVSLFRGDKRLLKRYLTTYGLEHWPALNGPTKNGLSFTKLAMIYCLLHSCDAFKSIYQWRPHLMKLKTLCELEKAVWDLNDVTI